MTIGTPLPNAREETYALARARLIPSRQACVDSGYPNPHNAARLEKRARIRRRIQELRHHDEVSIAWQRRVLREELMRVAMFRLPDLFIEVETKDDAGKVISVERQLRPLSEWSDEERAAIAELYADKDGIERVKPHSKLTAIDLLMKLDGLVDPDIIAVQVNNSTQVNNGGARSRIASRVEAIASRAHREPAGAGT